MHYYRNLLHETIEINKRFLKKEEVTDAELRSSLDKLKTFITNTLNDIKNVFDKITGDNCSICIKLIYDPEQDLAKAKIKTLYRDSTSFRIRKKYDLDSEHRTRIYPATDNTAFKSILDPNESSVIYFSDNLELQHSFRSYNNSNQYWNDFYNAVAVIPISYIPNRKKPKIRSILGFLCVDNMEGGFIYSSNEEYLSGIGDSFYNLFDGYKDIILNAVERQVDHEIIEKFLDWDYSGQITSNN